MTQPMARRASAPAPVDNASGSAPRTVASAVIKIGRNLNVAASKTCLYFFLSSPTQLISKFYDKNTVLRN
jgi:hypothetical protein